ncbi:MAG: isocitrate/isopropylmalate dehydrogenase family protein [Geminicoccaceae bacterium]
MSSSFDIVLFKGDGIGVDVSDAAFAVIEAARRRIGGFDLEIQEIDAGAAYYRDHGRDLAEGAEAAAAKSDAIFLGAIGLPSVRHADGTEIAPHLRMREMFQLYAGVRPVKAYPNAPQRLADERAAGIDLVVLRESTEGLFYSAATHNRDAVANDDEVQDILRITRPTTEKLHDFAFKLAAKRRERGGKGHVTCVDKANVFRSMAFFRKVFDERKGRFADIEIGYSYIDAMALDLIRKPWMFDVLVMENMFGDIISDLAGGLVGGMGMAACAEIGDEHGLFQPAHGSAPDIMGQDKANPLAAILSGALMLDYLADRSGEAAPAAAAALIESAVDHGFSENRLRPMEFGGDQGTRALTSELIDIVDDMAMAA